MKTSTLALSALAASVAMAAKSSSSMKMAGSASTGASSGGATRADPTSTDGAVVTVTSYTDDCSTASTSAGAIMTTYTTVYHTWCGCEETMTPNTYTITEPCTAVGQPMPTGYVPSGFTVTTEACPVCAVPTTGVITKPVATPAPSNGPAPAPAPAPSAAPAPAPAPAPAHAPYVASPAPAPASNSTSGCTGANGACSPPIQAASAADSLTIVGWAWAAVAGVMALL